MSLKEHTYSVLVVSAADNFNSVFTALLSGSKYFPIHTVSSISKAKRSISERSYDFILINSPLPDETGILFAIDACASKSTVVLLLVKSDIHDDIFDKVGKHGVFTLPKPTAKPTMLLALNWMSSTRERLKMFEKKTLSIEEKMEEIRQVNHAKWLLISELKMSESEAHHYIEKQAMDSCVSRKEIAKSIIRTYS